MQVKALVAKFDKVTSFYARCLSIIMAYILLVSVSLTRPNASCLLQCVQGKPFSELRINHSTIAKLTQYHSSAMSLQATVRGIEIYEQSGTVSSELQCALGGYKQLSDTHTTDAVVDITFERCCSYSDADTYTANSTNATEHTTSDDSLQYATVASSSVTYSSGVRVRLSGARYLFLNRFLAEQLAWFKERLALSLTPLRASCDDLLAGSAVVVYTVAMGREWTQGTVKLQQYQSQQQQQQLQHSSNSSTAAATAVASHATQQQQQQQQQRQQLKPSMEIVLVNCEVHLLEGSAARDALILFIPRLYMRRRDPLLPSQQLSVFCSTGLFPWEASSDDADVLQYSGPDNNPVELAQPLLAQATALEIEVGTQRARAAKVGRKLRNARRLLAQLEAADSDAAAAAAASGTDDTEREERVLGLVHQVNSVGTLQLEFESLDEATAANEATARALRDDAAALLQTAVDAAAGTQPLVPPACCLEIVLVEGVLCSWDSPTVMCNSLNLVAYMTPPLLPTPNTVVRRSSSASSSSSSSSSVTAAMYDSVWTALGYTADADPFAVRVPMQLRIRSTAPVKWFMTRKQYATLLAVIMGNCGEERECIPPLRVLAKAVCNPGPYMLDECLAGLAMAQLIDVVLPVATVTLSADDDVSEECDDMFDTTTATTATATGRTAAASSSGLQPAASGAKLADMLAHMQRIRTHTASDSVLHEVDDECVLGVIQARDLFLAIDRCVSVYLISHNSYCASAQCSVQAGKFCSAAHC
jgi:hypothetical protein